jgi:xylose isomerase-like TIM barrel
MIGFRVPSEMINMEFLHGYFDLFDFIEVKVKNTNKFFSLLQSLNNICLGKYSLHLPKHMLYNEEDFQSSMEILEIINSSKNTSLNLVTHFERYDIDMLKKMNIITDSIPQKCTLCIENIKTYDINYIDNLEHAINELSQRNIYICFDLGHFMYSGTKLGLSQGEMFEILKRKKLIWQRIKEIHIHDFNIETDHISLSKGIFERDILGKILDFLPIVPIVIETNVKNAKFDGINQVNWLKKI